MQKTGTRDLYLVNIPWKAHLIGRLETFVDRPVIPVTSSQTNPRLLPPQQPIQLPVDKRDPWFYGDLGHTRILPSSI